jgi:Methyltransferase domain
MQIDDYAFMVDAVTKFYNTIRVFGWFHHPEDKLAAIALVNDAQLACVSAVGIEHGGVEASHGPNKGFSLQVLRPEEGFNEEAELEFTTDSGWTTRVLLQDLCKERMNVHPTLDMMRRFVDTMNAQPGARVIDIGGRARSRIDRSALFTTAECVVLDILPGENVDVVGDAHDMARLFPPEHFDGVYSVSVFEHLLMPWAVVGQMNRMLKPGGLGMIFSHQTLGLHDAPWDFWRFSDTSWDALFNARTGFEIVERAMDFEQHILPFIWRANKAFDERVVGFEGSAVLIRKTGPCTLAWPVTPDEITSTMYPAGTL